VYGIQSKEITYDNGIKRDKMVGQKSKKERYSKKISIKYKDYLFLKKF